MSREYRELVEFSAFKDVGIGAHDAQREFSEPVKCYAKVTARTALRVIDDVNSFGTERAVTHLVKMRPMKMDTFTYMRWCNKWYRIFNATESDDRRSVTLGVIYQREQEKKAMTRTVFNQ